MAIKEMVDKILLEFFYKYEIKKFVLVKYKIYRFATAFCLRYTDIKNDMKFRKVIVAHYKVASYSPASDMGNKIIRNTKN
jgi:hypothetical protein